MKKLKAKLENIANTVGVAAHSDPQTNKTTKFDCRGGRLCPPTNRQDGITLIALIITIIVMLILVGVTINVALNGNLFGKADKAKRLTQIAADKEELQIEILTAYNEKTGEVELSTLKTNLEAKGWKVTVSGDKAICTSPKGNTFTVDKEGKIAEGGTHPGGGNEPIAFDWSSVGLTVDTSTEYIAENGPILNFSVDGKLVVLADDMVIATVDAKNSDNIDETTGNLSFDIESGETTVKAVVTMNENNTDVDFIVEGMGTLNCVKIVVDNEIIYSNEEVLKRLGITNYTGTYTGTWTKIGEENGKTKLVSTRAVANCILGDEDPRATDPQVENSLEEGAGEFEIAIWSYAHAVDTLNTAAKEATGIASAESITIEDIYEIIGEENVDKDSSYGDVYNYYFDTTESKVCSKKKTGIDENGEEQWGSAYTTGYATQTFVDSEGKTVTIDADNQNASVKLTNDFFGYTLTDTQKSAIGSLATGYYWLASPCVDCGSSSAYFNVRFMNGVGINGGSLFYSYGRAYSSGYGVRAVVSI